MSKYVGLDLGQASDYTALVIVEHTAPRMAIRHVERPALGTPYPKIVSWVCNLLDAPQMADVKALLIDATGVGRAVLDMFRLIELPCDIIPITITGGNNASRDNSGMRYVPKRDLIASIQVPLQEKTLVFANGMPLGPVLRAELLNFKMKINTRGHDSYEAGGASDWREGEHDDIVLAAALPCWYIQRGLGGVPVSVSGATEAPEDPILLAQYERMQEQQQVIDATIAERSPAIQSFLDRYRLNDQ